MARGWKRLIADFIKTRECLCWISTGVVTRVAQRVPQVDQRLIYPYGPPEFTSSAYYRSWCICSSLTCLNFLFHVVMSATIFAIGIYLWILVSNTIPYRLIILQRVLLVEHGRPDHRCSPGFRVAQVFYVVFCRSLFILFLLTIVLSVLRFTTSDYRYGIIQTDTSILKVWFYFRILIINICLQRMK